MMHVIVLVNIRLLKDGFGLELVQHLIKLSTWTPLVLAVRAAYT